MSLARKYEAPIVPMHVAGPWSGMFHFFNRFSTELRDMTLFHELLNKQGRAFALTVGRPIAPDGPGGRARRGDRAAEGLSWRRELPADPDRAVSR